ncbi:hypothetical protein CNMCM6805_000499 [Aspergillus fumigatiaffinis]|uniref:Uncharacterized protein n=1 Tax=Aspergillus fumigatiaffinis TaxID=340414 RepID=A0A8H4GXU0_9EURO|nr:hypothetical protein CNMCM5878_006648 [Aspergillus fumigatiaffinis]KAF4230976.1 hypothetical protein CNMCM6805_000499 [Aspergillus fumigatiaffinis]KAF4231803.1 hypothetical protein CNMCM6457_005102 [Aspergillus fumigatiaffinis]
MASRQQLWEAARAVITSLQAIPERHQAKVIIIGGTALENHIPGYRRTRDVDLLVFDRDDPICTRAIRAELLSLIRRNFEERSQPMYFTGNPDNLIQVDIIPPDLPPYLPADAATLGEVDPNHLPFLSLLDLLVYKIHCCSMRPSRRRRRHDAEDARKLVNILSRQGTIALDDSQV